ncbi:hypothetical protein AsAng_0029480 [Aureispira anguillae]|uniref:Uncharacterized protein n=1 Tax=Aureispira anguillae TaxID=2864201 RepID=A0A915YFT4_9BACT|nr:hypothetical protein AsAng_0029480 [Aureispira anguillae]
MNEAQLPCTKIQSLEGSFCTFQRMRSLYFRWMNEDYL